MPRNEESNPSDGSVVWSWNECTKAFNDNHDNYEVIIGVIVRLDHAYPVFGVQLLFSKFALQMNVHGDKHVKYVIVSA